jgi:uncharacterized repeat protein (TIGR02543 family)
MVRAQCSDFDILANGVSMNAPPGNSSLNYPIVIGENLEFTVSNVGSDLLWIISAVEVSDKPSYSPPIGLTATGNTSQTKTLKVQNCNVEKTINIQLSPRTYTVSYNSNGGSPVAPQTGILHNTLATKPVLDPTRTDYVFDYWYLSNENLQFNFSTPIIENITLTAKWKINTYTVTFDSDGGSAVSSQTIEHGKYATKPPNPTKANYDFVQWEMPVGTEYIFSTPVTGNITLTAKWVLKKYTVAFNSSGGSAISSQQVEHGSTASIPSNPTREGYDFAQWEMPVGTTYNFSTPVTSNITLIAKWNPKTYIITFNPQSGTVSPTSQSATYGSPVGTLPTPTRTGYDFNGWFDAAGTEYTSAKVYQTASDITLSARWKPKQYKINFDAQGGSGLPAKNVAYMEAIGELPESTKESYRFTGWFKSDSVQIKATDTYTVIGDITVYAHWEFVKGSRPTAAMLDYTLQNFTYNATQINIPVSQRSDVTFPIGNITVLYDGKTIGPKDAGTYAVSVFINKNDFYDSATVSLGNVTIVKATVILNVNAATVKDKVYDANTRAEITSIGFDESPLFAGDIVSRSDYSAEANFASQNAGTWTVNINVNWLGTGQLAKNYVINTPTFSSLTASITRAIGELHINPPQNYQLTLKPAITYRKSDFVPNGEVRLEYKREGETYSSNEPNRVGTWTVKAYFNGNNNYTGAEDSVTFTVTRGNAKPVMHTIEIDGFKEDGVLSKKPYYYHVTGTDFCEGKIKDTTIQMTINEYDIKLILMKIPNNPPYELLQPKSPINFPDIDGFSKYEIPFSFGKPGLDTMIYILVSEDGIYRDTNWLLIETPVSFDSVVRQKWNNVLFINNNPKTNGGYEFSDFKWFKNGDEIGKMQFYSAGPSSADTLELKDKYKVTMHTKDGIRISTCEDNPKSQTVSNLVKPKFTKQVLGINGRSVKNGTDIYNMKGSLTKDTPAGMYIVKEEFGIEN